MFLGTASGLSLIMVIVCLEVLLLVDSIALTIQSQRKVVKIVNALLAIIWIVCIVMNVITFGLI